MSRRAMRRAAGLRLLALAALAAACLPAAPLHAATFPSNASVSFQTSGCRRGAGVGDWYTAPTSASTTRYGEFFLEVTNAMAPATVVIVDAESTAGGVNPTVDEVTGAGDPTRFELRSGDGVTLLAGTTLASGTANGTTITFAGIAAGVYRIRSYTGSDQVPGLATGAYCDQAVGDNDDDNSFQIQVNGGAAIDGLLGFLQTTYQQNSGAALDYQMYFLVGPAAADSTLALRNFDLDLNATSVNYNRTPDGGGAVVAGTESADGVWNNGGTLNAGQDSVAANNDLAGGAQEAGAWGYRINGWSSGNQTIFEANDTGVRVALSDTLPPRAGNFTLLPNAAIATTVGTPVDHPFTVTNQYLSSDAVNFTLGNTSANYTTQLLGYPVGNACGVGALTALTDGDNNGQLDTGLLTSINTAQASRCLVLRVTPLAGASSSDTTRVNGVSLMDGKVGTGNTTRFVDKTTLLPPSIAKAFSPNPLATGGTATLSFTLSNINTVPATLSSAGPNFAFTDVFPVAPGAMTLANTAVTNGCGGTLTDNAGGALNAGDTGIRYSGGAIPASGSCTVAVNVTATTEGAYLNTTTALASTTAGTGNTAGSTLTVLAMTPPSLEKAFGPNPVGLNTDSTLTLTLTNTNPAVLSGLALSDTYPAGLVNAPTPAVTNTCGGAVTGGAAGGNTLGLTGGSLAAGSSCSITVQVRGAAAGNYLNTTGAVTSTNGGTGNAASATLVVHAPPTIAKSFSPDPINNGDAAVLTLTLANPNSTAMTGAAFTDTYPAAPASAAIVNTGTPAGSTTCGGGAVTAAAGGGSVALSGGVIPASGSCVVTVNVTKNAAGAGVNTIPIGGLTTTNGISSTVAASDTLTSQAIAGPTVTKSFSPDPIQNGGNSTLTIVVGNPNPTAALAGVAFTDTYPAAPAANAITNFTTANPALNCTAGSVGTLTGGANGGPNVGMAGGSILAGGSCTITVRVTKAATGTGTNTIPIGGVTTSNGGANTVAASDTLTSAAALVAPTFTKAFSPNEPGLNGVSTLTFTVNNPNNATLNNVSFTDTYPAGLVNATPSGVVTTCGFSADTGATFTGGVAGGNTIGLNGATGGGGSDTDMPANSTCTLSVNVTSAAAGVYNNTTGAITGRNGNAGGSATLTGGTASAPITFVRPGITKSFSPDPIASGGASTLTIVLTNDSDVAMTINNPGFTDVFPVVPGAMTVAAPLTTSNTCGGTLNDSGNGALAAGDVGIRLNTGSIPAHGSCQLTVNVTASAAGTYTNTIAAGNLSTSGGTNAAAASDTLTVPVRPTVAQAFNAATIPVLGVSTLTVTLSNSNPLAATNAAFTDALPAGLVTLGAPSTNCGGIASSTGSSVSLAGGTIPAGAPGSCTVTVSVLNDADTDATVNQAQGVYVSTLAAGALSTSFGTNIAAATANLNVLGGYKSVRLQTDADASGTVTVGDTLQWSVFYRNPTGGVAVAAFQVTDAVGAGMTVSGTPAVSYTPVACSAGTANAAFNGVGNPNLFSAAFAFNAACTVRVDYSVTVGAAAAGTTLSNQASGSGTGLIATPSDNIDTTTAGLPAGVTPTAGSLVQAQARTLIGPTAVAVIATPSIAAVKSSTAFSDPFNNLVDPKRIPGGFVTYTLVVTNSGAGAVDANTTVVIDPVPAGTALFVGDLGGAGSGPVAFTDGAPSSGLTYTFSGLGNAADDLRFFSDAGCAAEITPTPDAGGADASVRCIRVEPNGIFAGDAVAGAPSPGFTLNFRVRVE